MSFFDAITSAFTGNPVTATLGAISLGAELIGGVTEVAGGLSQADAYEDSAALALQFGEEQARWATELSALEADLTERRGRSSEEIALFNAGLAEQNAEWIRLSGEAALRQARIAGEARVSSISVALASQGRRVGGGTSRALVEEGLAAVDRDLENIRLTTAAQEARAEGQAGLFTLEGARALEFSLEQAEGTRRAGEIEAEGIRRGAQIDARTGQLQAGTARLGAAGDGIRTAGSLARGVADFGRAFNVF